MLATLTLLLFAKATPVIDSWLLTAPLPDGVVGGQAVAYGDQLYLVGGASQPTRVSAVVAAQLDNDQSIIQWNAITSTLPISLQLHALVQATDAVYVIGGWDGANRYATVWRSLLSTPTPAPGATATPIPQLPAATPTPLLRTWETMRTYPQRIVLHSAVLAGNRIYVLGGVDENNKPLDRVFFAELDANGNLGVWQETRRLPSERFRLAAVAHQQGGTDYLYVLGGYDGEQSFRDVYFAAIWDTGQLNTWTKTTSLPKAMYYHQAVIYQDRLVVLGGRDDTDQFDNVYSAPFMEDGKLGEWVTEPHLPTAIYHFGAVVLAPQPPQASTIYLIGGLRSDIYQAQVYRARPPSPTPTATFTPFVAPTATATPTPTPGLASLRLSNEPDMALTPNAIVTFRIDYQNGEHVLENVQLTNPVPADLAVVVNSLQSSSASSLSLTEATQANVLVWTFLTPLAANAQGTVTYQAQKLSSDPAVVTNQGVYATWSYAGQPDSMQSNPTFNPAQKVFLPWIAR